MKYKITDPITFYNCVKWDFITPEGRQISGYNVLVLDPDAPDARTAIVDFQITPKKAEELGLLTPEGVKKYYLQKVIITGTLRNNIKQKKVLYVENIEMTGEQADEKVVEAWTDPENKIKI